MDKEALVSIIERCQAGDTSAQEALILEVQQSIYYQCLKFLHHPENAQDATQDILINMLTKLHTLNQPEAFWGWINRMTANHCKNLLRKTGEFQIPEDEEGNSLLDTYETLDEQMVPDKALDNKETCRMVIEMIDALPAPQRMCVIMYYYNEMSVKDIASTLEVSENTIKSRLNYARKAIKEGAEKYQKQGIKLCGFSPLPFLLHFLLEDANISALDADVCRAMADNVLASLGSTTTAALGASSAAGQSTASSGGPVTATASAGDTVAKTGVTAAVKGASLGTKIVAGVLSAAVVLGGGGMLLHTVLKNDAPPAEPTAITSGTPQSLTGEEQFHSEQPQHPYIQLLDKYDAFYASLFDLDGDGVDELLLGVLNQSESFNEAFPVSLWAFDTEGNQTMFHYLVSTDEELGPEEWAIYRHCVTGSCFLGQHYVYSQDNDGFAPEYQFVQEHELEQNEYQLQRSIFENRGETFWYGPPGSNMISEIAQKEYYARLAEYELLLSLPFSRTTADFTQFRYTVDEVREQLENTAE